MNAPSFLALALIAGLGSWALWEHRANDSLRAEIAALKDTVSRLEKTARLKVSLATGTEVDASGPRGLGDIAPDTSPADTPEAAVPGKPKASEPADVMAQMLRNPAAREAMKVQTRAQLESEYADLFAQMGLDEATSDAVMKLVADRALAQMDAALAMGGKADDESRKAAAAAIKDSQEKTEKSLREKLGDKYATLERFEKSAPERQQLKLVRAAFKDKGIAFDEATESKLMDTMYGVRSGWKFDHDFSNPASLTPDSLTDGAMDSYLEQSAKMNEAVLSEVKNFLSAEQFEAFRTAQQQQQEMMQMGMKMSRGIFGGGQKKGD